MQHVLSLIFIDEFIKLLIFFYFYNMNVHANFLNRNVLALCAVDNRRTVLLINANIRLCYINMFQQSYVTTMNWLGLRDYSLIN